VEKALAICKAEDAKAFAEAPSSMREIERDAGKSQKEAEVALVPDLLVPSYQARIDRIRALGAPRGDEAQVEAILAAMQEMTDEAKADPAKYHYAMVHFEHPYRKAKARAEGYGIGDCVEPRA
jgi:hypothetical protein